jgi:hypothetical protein
LLFGCGPADTGTVSPVAELVLAALLPTIAVFALICAWRGAWRLSEARYKAPPAEPVERVQADLRRLRAELEDTESRAGLTAKHHRVQALRRAYLDALREACRRLEVAPPAAGYRVPLAEIYRAEAALRQRGLDVRETAAR